MLHLVLCYLLLLHESFKNVEIFNRFESKDPTPLSFQDIDFIPEMKEQPH